MQTKALRGEWANTYVGSCTLLGVLEDSGRGAPALWQGRVGLGESSGGVPCFPRVIPHFSKGGQDEDSPLGAAQIT